MDRWRVSTLETTYTPELKQRMKNIFVLYLWDMFDGPDAITNTDTIYIRNAIWYYRNLYFRNRAVFHWMINTLFKPFWDLHEAEADGEILRKQLRDFFRLTMLCFILHFSPQDRTNMRYNHHPNPRISTIINHKLSSSLADYHEENHIRMPDRARDRLENYFVFECRRNFDFFRAHQEDIHEAFQAPMLPGDIFARILREADHTDAIWEPPRSRDEVVNYIQELNGWNEM